MDRQPNLINDIYKNIVTGNAALDLRISIALDAAVAFGIHQSRMGKYDNISDVKLLDTFFNNADRLKK